MNALRITRSTYLAAFLLGALIALLLLLPANASPRPAGEACRQAVPPACRDE